jgi:hypothetical protein
MKMQQSKAQCRVCNMECASFNIPIPHLHLFPIGLSMECKFRWTITIDNALQSICANKGGTIVDTYIELI